MSTSLEPGRYVVAVSGGVDSVVLLHTLYTEPALTLVVAHFDHGIRTDSGDDAAFVAGLAEQYGLEFVGGIVKLGPDASEDTARKHRYEFLHDVRVQTGAGAVVTAHHQDDVIETALMNVMRGTKRRGFVSLRSTETIKRPLLGMTKQAIREYATEHCLEWVEDSTNREMKFTRNRIRAQLYRRLTSLKRNQILVQLETINSCNTYIDVLLDEILMKIKNNLSKEMISKTDKLVAAEIIASWLRRNQASFDKKTIERVLEGAKELQNGSKIDIDKQYYCLLTKNEIILTPR